MIKAIFWDFYGVINIQGQLNPELAEFIKRNKDEYRFAILSASDVDLHPWLQQNNIDRYFDLVQSTNELGIAKSDPRFYESALEKLKLRPHEAIFVDDTQHYLDVAAKLGVKAVLFDKHTLATIEGFTAYN